MSINYCSNCGAKVLKNAHFCGECGNKISQTQEPKKNNSKQCSNCDYSTQGDESYCPDCGNKLIAGGQEKKTKAQEPEPTRKKVSEPVAKGTPESVKKK